MGHVMGKLSDILSVDCRFPINGDRESRILMLGLDAAGKTTILYRVKFNEAVTTIPTIGFNVETVTPVPNVTLCVWDVGGQQKVRALWQHYFCETHGLVFVVDSADKARLWEARDELMRALTNPYMTPGIPVVVLANKQDLPGALSASEITDIMDLKRLSPNHPWYVQPTQGNTGVGLHDAFKVLARMVKQFHKDLSKAELINRHESGPDATEV
ncbi:ADP-ribosylation factor 1-like 2 [Diadema antillarum]|uniref:ADP-ribosylation factor 1-like 2 n=1 Tax=Diadema antillarum TaxID=105358 RepID=UPI003A8AF52E